MTKYSNNDFIFIVSFVLSIDEYLLEESWQREITK